MEEKKLVPKRRFNELTKNWQISLLEDILEIHSGQDYKHLNEGSIPVYGTGGYMLSVNDKLSDEDAIGIGRKGTIDKPQYLKAPFWTVDTLFYMMPKSNMNLLFLYYLALLIKWRTFDESTGVPSLSKNTIEKIQVIIPSKTEQQKIGEFFKVLDERIANQERKIAKVKALKEAYLTEMFPQAGETVPKRRFAGFEGEWDKISVKDIFKVTRGTVLSTTQVKKAKSHKYPYPVYSSQTQNNGLLGYYSNYLFDTAITWTTDGANAGTVNFREGKFYSTNVNGVLLSQEGYACKAVAESLNMIAWKYVSKVGNPKLMNNVMGEIELILPTDLIELRKISTFFKNLDDQIATEEAKLAKLKEMKEAYLEEMFV